MAVIHYLAGTEPSYIDHTQHTHTHTHTHTPTHPHTHTHTDTAKRDSSGRVIERSSRCVREKKKRRKKKIRRAGRFGTIKRRKSGGREGAQCASIPSIPCIAPPLPRHCPSIAPSMPLGGEEEAGMRPRDRAGVCERKITV